MIGKAVAAGLAGLGLIGGAGTVIYNNSGDATVKVRDSATGKPLSVHLRSGGHSFNCPDGERAKVEPNIVELGRIELTIRRLRREERKVERRYPSGLAPHPVVVRYKSMFRRDRRLVAAFNVDVDRYNATLNADCKRTGGGASG